MKDYKKKYGLHLMKGLPITMDCGVDIYPVKINDIINIEELNYNKYLNFLTLEVDDIKKIFYDIPNLVENINSTFDFIVLYCNFNDELKSFIEEAMECFIKKDVNFIINTNTFAIGEMGDFKFITETNYEEFKKIVQIQNCIDKNVKEYFNPKNKKAEEIRKKLESAKKILNKVKKNEDESENLTLSDLISIASSNCNGINIFNVWDLTIYQLNDQFNRMKMMEDFNINIQQLLAGADPSKVEIKHWMKKIN